MSTQSRGPLLRVVSAAEIRRTRRAAVDALTLEEARPIVDSVEREGEEALRAHAERLGDLEPGGRLVWTRAELEAALAAFPATERGVLERTAVRIGAFARAQRAALVDVTVPIPGGEAGHVVAPVERAGCYAPGGRFPLPSSVLMTAVTAREAGVETVWVASPRPTPATLAAAAVAGADALLAVGGAQAIAALAFGAGPVPACDVVVGPGNRWVTAAKQLVSGRVRIDQLAGPSELLVWADGAADAEWVAADLLAQAEHDPDAMPMLVTESAKLIEAVERALAAGLAGLPTAETARAALENGVAIQVADAAEGAAICDAVAPEHLEVHRADAEEWMPRLRHYGGLFVGAGAAEVLGDYGAGPNHTLPTGGTARFDGGLSVLNFLRVRTWMRVDDLTAADGLLEDTARLGRMEGLEAHARAADVRRRKA